MTFVNEIEISYDKEYDDYEVCLLTINTDLPHAESVALARCLLKTKDLSNAVNIGITSATRRHVALGFSLEAHVKINEIYPDISYVLIACKMVSNINTAFFDIERKGIIREIEDADMFNPNNYELDEEDEDEL